MARPKYSEKERACMTRAFIEAAREIANDEGIGGISIRKVASRTGYNSATLYLYFENLDELVTLASLSYLEGYCRALAREGKIPRDSHEELLFVWRVFGIHAFTYPQVFNHLFFAPHEAPLEDTIGRFYRLFPDQLDEMGAIMEEMLLAGSLQRRNMVLLTPLCNEGLIDKGDIDIVNELMICYFHRMLDEQRARREAEPAEQLVERLLHAIRFLVDRSGRSPS